MHLSREKQRLAVVGLLILWCTALNFYGFYLGPSDLGVGLLWNLLLAAVPLIWSAAFQSACSRNQYLRAILFFFMWLIFFPNAPYLLTDLKHLRPLPSVPDWYLLAMLLSFAGAGTMLGYFSLFSIHSSIERKFGAVAGWIVASGSLLLCGFGIYVGRYLRWNSWNAINNPFNLARDITSRFTDPGMHPHPFGVTAVYSVGLILGYMALRVFAFSEHSKG